MQKSIWTIASYMKDTQVKEKSPMSTLSMHRNNASHCELGLLSPGPGSTKSSKWDKLTILKRIRVGAEGELRRHLCPPSASVSWPRVSSTVSSRRRSRTGWLGSTALLQSDTLRPAPRPRPGPISSLEGGNAKSAPAPVAVVAAS